jgi:hypothetical protein
MKNKTNLLWIFAFSFVIAPTDASAQGIPLLTTITNPAPAANDYFGGAVAAVGGDRVLIGAYRDDLGTTDAGAAYLFNTGGALRTTFTNPTPAANDAFGYSVAAVGADRVLIGAYADDRGATDAGVAYLFDTNGLLLATFPNPAPAASDYFGYAVAAMGSDRALIGAPNDDRGTTDAGTAYLFSTNGTLLTTFTNPTPALKDYFGCAAAAVGADRVLVGAYEDDRGALDAGAAYLFSTNGLLLTTFTNPATLLVGGERFGYAVAAVGLDRVLIGAIDATAGVISPGAAYLFNTNGVLLTTFTNPTPAGGDLFGYCVAAVGSDRVLIGAHSDNTGATDAGSAYWFSTNGVLLNTFTNPAPAAGDWFGCAVAAAEGAWLAIGAYLDDAGAANAGTVYLYALQSPAPPPLSVRCTTTNTVLVSWPKPADGWNLECATELGAGASVWTQIPPPYQTNATDIFYVEPPPATNRFYRLHKP